MTTVRSNRTVLCALAVAASATAWSTPCEAQDRIKAIVAETLYTMGPAGTLEDGVVVFGPDGKVAAVGPAAGTAIPDGPGVVLRCAVATPGLVDARSVVGLAGYLNQDQDQDQLDPSEPMQPELRAFDAYSPREPLVAWVRSFGVTTLHTGHAPGALIPGQTFLVKTRGNSVEEAMLRPMATVTASLGSAAVRSGGKPGNRSKAVAMLRQAMIDARRRLEKDDPEPDLRMEALARVLRREVPLMVHAHESRDILTALRLQEEFGFELILEGAAEAYLVLDRLAAAGVPVIAHAPMARHRGELQNATFTLGAQLADAGIRFAYESGFEAYVPKTRVVLLEAAVGAANGLGIEGALRAITIDAARILGVDDRVGSLEVGKDADVACYDGDPFEYTSHCEATVIEGVVAFQGRR